MKASGLRMLFAGTLSFTLLPFISGTIDEVEKIVHITWVQPRVLDKEQVRIVKIPSLFFVLLVLLT